jgi:anti-anti-sigma regulatory factor
VTSKSFYSIVEIDRFWLRSFRGLVQNLNLTTYTEDPMPIAHSESDVSQASDAEPPDSLAHTIVLQPSGCLGVTGTPDFIRSLHQALAQVDEVIVDLLWVDTVSEEGLQLLLEAMAKAKSLGKLLSFLGMDAATRMALDEGWDRQRDHDATVQSDLFMPDFEAFLETYKAEKYAALAMKQTA